MGKKSISEGVKWKVVGLNKQGNQSNDAIAKLVGVSEGCIRNTFKKFKDKDCPRSDRPSKLTERHKNVIFCTVRSNPRISIRNLTRELKDSLKNVTIGKETVRKVLLNKSLGSYIAIKKPLLIVKDRLK